MSNAQSTGEEKTPHSTVYSYIGLNMINDKLVHEVVWGLKLYFNYWNKVTTIYFSIVNNSNHNE